MNNNNQDVDSWELFLGGVHQLKRGMGGGGVPTWQDLELARHHASMHTAYDATDSSMSWHHDRLTLKGFLKCTRFSSTASFQGTIYLISLFLMDH